MTISAKVIADSISPAGIRLTTLQLRYPRFIHAEFMTHRVFSRNASSSRAIPVERMIADLRQDPAMPVFWGSNKPGMQAGEELPGGELTSPRSVCQFVWLNAMEVAIDHAKRLIEEGLHKQIANRILEPWAHINVVVTATDWDNFFELRAHPDAQPEIHALALEMLNAMAGSQPEHLQPGEWHVPYITNDERRDAYHGPSQTPEWGLLRKVSTARCARVSYLTHDGRPTTVEEDLALFDRLVGSKPLHASPAEHQATPDTTVTERDTMMAQYGGWRPSDDEWAQPHLHGNFSGWVQHRKLLEI